MARISRLVGLPSLNFAHYTNSNTWMQTLEQIPEEPEIYISSEEYKEYMCRQKRIEHEISNSYWLGFIDGTLACATLYLLVQFVKFR